MLKKAVVEDFVLIHLNRCKKNTKYLKKCKMKLNCNSTTLQKIGILHIFLKKMVVVMAPPTDPQKISQNAFIKPSKVAPSVDNITVGVGEERFVRP